MEKLPLKQLIKMALFTIPLITVIYATPMYIFDAIPQTPGFLVFPVVMVPISIAWFWNIFFLAIIKAKWIRTFIRLFLVSLIMYAISGIVIHTINPFVRTSEANAMMIRIVNILSVNAIIYILIDLTLTKENKNKIELENANLKLVKLEGDYKLLKDQINPHFLFNALSTAKALVKPQPELAEEYIIRLSDFLRASINNSQKTISLQEELQLCKDFVTLNQIRFGESIKLENKISIDTDTNFVPYFSILSLIENAIKHNVFSVESPLLISLTINENNIEVKNNFKPKFTLEATTKTGLKNLNERYKLLSGKEIIVNKTDEFYSVKIPLLKE